MEEIGFRDATFQFTYSDGGVYGFYEKQGDLKATQEIAEITTQELLDSFNTDQNRIIEIQSKPYLNISELLNKHPNKTAVTSIRITANGLKEFPAELFDYSNLEQLYIYNNQIKKAPENLKKLSKLWTVNIHSNPIKDDKAEMAHLQELLPKDCKVVCF
ncbi:MAG: leucine-rich repeat domain-containing protein [Aureispira sp.]|nr:leucine-rich repeat domain-containing protein [Aureispira sp.]